MKAATPRFVFGQGLAKQLGDALKFLSIVRRQATLQAASLCLRACSAADVRL